METKKKKKIYDQKAHSEIRRQRIKILEKNKCLKDEKKAKNKYR